MAVKGQEGAVLLSTSKMEGMCTVINKTCSENIKILEAVRARKTQLIDGLNLSGGQGEEILTMYRQVEKQIDELVDQSMKIRRDADNKLRAVMDIQKDKHGIGDMAQKTGSLRSKKQVK